MAAQDERWIRRAIAVAQQAKAEGNGPLGSVFVDASACSDDAVLRW